MPDLDVISALKRADTPMSKRNEKRLIKADQKAQRELQEAESIGMTSASIDQVTEVWGFDVDDGVDRFFDRLEADDARGDYDLEGRVA